MTTTTTTTPTTTTTTPTTDASTAIGAVDDRDSRRSGAAHVHASTQLVALVARNLRTTARVPQLLMFSLTMPMAMLVLFSQVFRSIADSPSFPDGVTYIDFVTPAMLAVATVMAGTNVGVAAAIDHTTGVHDRFRTLAMAAWLPAAARTVNEMVVTVVRAALLVAVAAALGFGFHGTALDAAAGVIVLAVLAAAMSALFGRIGDRLQRPDVVQFAGMMVMMPFMFVSSAFAPTDTMPSALRTAASLNPVHHATNALRGAVLGTADPADFAIAVCASLTMWALVTLSSVRR